MTKGSRETPTPAASGMPTRLHTHCGIKELRVEDTFFFAETPLDDGHGNPPPGWRNPYQDGAVTVSGSKVVFKTTKTTSSPSLFVPVPPAFSRPVPDKRHSIR
jgi:hypothetical protein